MKKWNSLIFLLLLTVGIMVGCGEEKAPVQENNVVEEKGQAEEQVAESHFPIKIIDAANEEVVIEEEPKSIVSIIPSNTEIAFALGLGEKIVGVSESDNYPEETADKEKVSGMEINVEKILSLAPDLVLAHAASSYWGEAIQQLKAAGIPVLTVINAENFEQVYDSIIMIGKATGEVAKAETIIEEMKAKIAAIQVKASEITTKRSVAFEIQGAPEIFVAANNTFMHEILTIIHADNAVGDLDGWQKIDQEGLIERNPDVIITTYGYYTEGAIEQVLSRAGWQDVRAVKNKQVFDVHSDLVSRSGPRLAEGVEEVAKIVYPEIFNK